MMIFCIDSIRRHFEHLHELAARAEVPGGKLILAVYGENPATGEKLSATQIQFEIGAVKEMTDAAIAFAAELHANVYAPLVVFRAETPAGSRKKEDIAAVLGLVVDGDADKGKEAPQPPVPANYIIESSAGNQQHFLIFDRPLPPAEATELAKRLKLATGADAANEIGHVWRVPGCLNWPNAAKIKRGRSPEPQPVRVVQPFNSWTRVDDLREALKGSEGKKPEKKKREPKAAAPKGETLTPPSARTLDPIKVRNFHERLRDAGYYDAGPDARTRYVAAAKALSHDLGGEGRKLWEEVVCWKGGREGEGAAVTTEEAEARWRDCSQLKPGTRPKTHGTLIDDAKKVYGWSGIWLDAEMFDGLVTTTAPPIAPVGGGRGMPLIGGGPLPLPRDSEDALALSFAEMRAGDLRHCEEWGKWLEWNGQVWKTDKTAAVYDAVRKHIRSLATGMHPQDARKIVNAKTVAAVERMARTDRCIATAGDVWDADPWLLNTPGGVVDLRTGQMRAALPDDHMTKTTAVAPGGDCPTWLAFLNRSLGGEAELIGFVQRMLGYALTGDTREHALFFLYGRGGNGKGVLLNTVAALLADYQTTAPAETFIDSPHERHPTDLAGLRGARLVTVTETEKGKRWAESKIKTLTGGDKVSARFMRQDFFEFIPQFKLIISGNHKPGLRAVDEAIRRRLHLVPFTIDIPAAERDAALPEKLKAEWGGILAWLIEGCLAWQRSGLQPPPAVRAATDEYLSSEDVLGTWLDERCDQGVGHWATREALFTSWSGWCRAASEFAGSQKMFLEAMRQRHFEEAKRDGVRGFRGVRVKPVEMSEMPPMPSSRAPLPPLPY
jgi:P4 family phage/plasmid primase-like protien